MSNTFIINSPIGDLALSFHQNKLSRIEFTGMHQSDLARNDTPNNPLLQSVTQELHSYFQNPRHAFSLSLHIDGTPFQQKVWNALRQIPVGHTLSYSELARKLKTSARAIGNACRTNRLPLIIPCHRITGKNNLGGFGGATTGRTLEIKKWLLQHEAL
ncbi:MAG TPA: methylated-DNA--[protein]-cysteine S-methyltransferase [Gammaproteobacteria bacterium]|nr:methylated-DNA--[protein]-cysteine S-methyltransferase [Gammaproteobacteria bacterium]